LFKPSLSFTVQQADVHLGRQGGGVKLLDHLYRGAGISGQGLFITNRIRTLVAVAALVATGAFAQVSITGVMETAVQINGGTTSISGGNNGTSEVSIGVSEDLGNGIKAIASSTICLNPMQGDLAGNIACNKPTAGGTGTSSAANSYNGYIGLSGEFGTAKLGQQFTRNFFTSLAADVNGRGIGGSQVGGTQGQIANSINYTSPSFAGVSVSVQQTLSDSATNKYNSYSLDYAAGALGLSYSSGKTGSTTESVVAANYDFGMAKVFYGTGTTSSTTDKNSSAFGVSVPVGAFTLTAASNKDTAGKTGTTLGATYNLSKRTSVYAVNVDNAYSTTGNGNYIGIRHNF